MTQATGDRLAQLEPVGFGQGVEHELALGPVVDRPEIAQLPELLGSARHGQTEQLRQIADAELTSIECLEYPQAIGTLIIGLIATSVVQGRWEWIS